MKITRLVVLLSVAFGAISLLAAATKTINGTITDSMCGAHHMMQGARAAECTRACVKQGAGYALVSGDKVYTLKGDAAQLDKFAGQNVTVKGELSDKTHSEFDHCGQIAPCVTRPWRSLCDGPLVWSRPEALAAKETHCVLGC